MAKKQKERRPREFSPEGFGFEIPNRPIKKKERDTAKKSDEKKKK